LIKYYKLKPAENEKDKKRIQNVLSVWGYVMHHQMAKNKYREIIAYTTRRWDLFHTYSATKVSLIFSSILGVSIRLLYFVIKNGIKIPILIQLESGIIGAIIVSAIILSVLLDKSREWIIGQYSRVNFALINEAKKDITEKELREIFPEEYFLQEVEDKDK
jgi:hypothetical protein